MAPLIHLWQTQHWRLLGVACIAGYLLFVVWVLAPAGAALWQRRTQLIEHRAQLDQVRTGMVTEQRLRPRIQTLQAILRRVRPEEGTSVAALVTPLDEAARQAGLTVTALTADTTRVQGQQVAWPLHLQAAGRYHQVGAFLDQMERQPGRLVIDRLDLTAPQMTRSLLTLQLDLTSYHRPATLTEDRR